MQIHNAIITGSFSYNGADLSNVTSSNAYSASLSSRTTDLESTSSVLVGASSSFSLILSSVSSSQQQISSSYIALSGSYNTLSGSASTRVTQIEQVYATTGSNSFRATQSITGSLTVTGQIIAQTINVQQVTSSIVFSSGSNTFGCDLNSRQTFTGSFFQTGSVACFSNTLFGNIISGNAAAVSGSGTFGTCMTNGDFTIISNSIPFVIKGRQTYDRGFLGLTWDASPDVGIMVGNSLGFNTNSIPGSNAGTRALTLACNGAATLSANDASGNRINPFNTLTITTDNPNLPYGFFGGAILFKNRSYTSGLVDSARIRSVIYDDGAPNNFGGGLWFETTPTPGGTLTPSLVINYQGRVGIGTTNPTEILHLNSSNCGAFIRFQNTGGSGTYLGSRNDNMEIYTGGGEKMRITSGGNVGIGTTSTGFNAAGLPLVVGSGSGNTGLTIFSGASGVGSIHFADAETDSGSASYAGYINYGHTDNSMQFGTNAAERMRITSAGIACFACQVCAPTFTAANGSIFGVASTTGPAINLQAGSNCRAIIFKNAGGGDGSLWLYGTSTSIDYSFSTYSVGSAFYLCNNGNYDFYGSDISDRRQKCNICYISDSQIYNIMKLKSVSFNKKTLMGGLNNNVHTGFIAQDVLEAGIPNLVHGKEEEGYGLDYNGILSLAVKAIQEQQCTICSQASMINTLKTCLGII